MRSMASVLHKTTKQYIPSVNTPDYMDGNWIINPDMTTLMAYPSKYWIIEGNSVRVADSSEQAAIDVLEGYEGLTALEVVAKLHAKINEYREEYVNQGVIFNGYLFDADQRARENITGMCSAIALGVPIPEGFTWRSKLNEDVPMTSAQLVQFGLTAMTFVSTSYSASWYHKDTLTAMAATASVDDLLAYNYTLGWPNNSMDGSELNTPPNNDA